jgi:hypothetical protein
MRKFLSNGAIFFAGMMSVPAVVTTVDAQLPLMAETPNGTYKPDPRVHLLRNFFASIAAPAKDYSHVFLSAADHYSLDWRLLPSISFVETTGGKAARNNNFFGWNSGRAEFTSVTEGIRTVAYHLANARPYKNKDLDEMLWAYNPNLEYSRKVKAVMSRIAPAK